MGRKKNIREEETRTQMQSEDLVLEAVRGFVETGSSPFGLSIGRDKTSLLTEYSRFSSDLSIFAPDS